MVSGRAQSGEASPSSNSTTLNPQKWHLVDRLTDVKTKATGLPSGWEVRHSNSKNLPYYFNPNTKESRWEPPSETDSETLKHYMGQYHTANLRPDAAASAGTGNLDGKIRCAHLLVKHRDSRRPNSWREAEITRTREEALAIIQAHEQLIKSGATSLGDLATTESDCSSARKRGDLGFFGRGDMQREFEEVSFTLKPGEISPVVQTQSGLHLIERLVSLAPEPAQEFSVYHVARPELLSLTPAELMHAERVFQTSRAGS